MKKTWLLILVSCFILIGGNTARAEDKLMLWSDTSLSLLTGSGFELVGSKASTLTFEHASGWAWGDVFMFADYQVLHDNAVRNDRWFGEFSPRLSLTKLTGGTPNKEGLIKEYFISTTWERGENGVEALLLGVAADLNISGFRFFKLNLYAHKQGGFEVGADDMQLTWSWSRPFKVGDQLFAIDGFMDYEFGLGDAVPNLHLVPQIKWDIGAAMGGKEKRFYIGSELDIWVNKFGIRNSGALDTNEFAVNLLFKAHF